jgi:transcriptional regulator with XRE-family HTH domain
LESKKTVDISSSIDKNTLLKIGGKLKKMEKKQSFNILVGKKVRLLRQRDGMSQVDLAKLLGYTSTGTISQVERGLRGMDVDKIIQTAKIFGISPEFLLSDKEYDEQSLKMIVNFQKIIENPQSTKFKRLQETLRDLTKD